MIAIGTNVITCYFCSPCNKCFHANMFKTKVPHKYRPGNIPLRYVVPTFDHRSEAKEDSEACFKCKEEIRFKERGAIATPCCDYFVYTECYKNGTGHKGEKTKQRRASCVVIPGTPRRFVRFANGIKQHGKPAN